METLASTFVGGRVLISIDRTASRDFVSRDSASKVPGVRCFACPAEDAVVFSSEKTKEKKNAMIDILRSGLGRSNSSWWAPLFNLPSETSCLSSHQSVKNTANSSADTILPSNHPNLSQALSIDSVLNKEEGHLTMPRSVNERPLLETLTTQGSPCSDGGKKSERRQWRPSKFTAEKARMLRQELRASETWHDLMYHSAIASRLATPDN